MRKYGKWYFNKINVFAEDFKKFDLLTEYDDYAVFEPSKAIRYEYESK